MRSSKRVLRALPALVLGSTLPVSPAEGQTPSSSVVERLDAVIDGALDEDRVVGLVLLVARDGRPVYSRAAGYADREAGQPIREDHVFRFASVTKPIVSAAALALVEEVRLDLDDDVATWLPHFRPRLADGGPAEITVRQLLTHTAGLTYGFLEPSDHPYHRVGVSDGLDLAHVTLDENLRRISTVPLSYRPGSAWGYTVAHDVLGAVVASAAGTTLPEAARTLVTQPLRMSDTEFVASDSSRVAAAYADGSPRPVRMSDPYTLPFGPGAGIRFSPGRAFLAEGFPFRRGRHARHGGRYPTISRDPSNGWRADPRPELGQRDDA